MTRLRYLLALALLATVVFVPTVQSFGGTWETLYVGENGLDCGGPAGGCYDGAEAP